MSPRTAFALVACLLFACAWFVSTPVPGVAPAPTNTVFWALLMILGMASFILSFTAPEEWPQ